MAAEPSSLKEARRIFVRLRLDTSVIHIRMERGILMVTGRICYPDLMGEGGRGVNYELLHEMHRRLCQLADVKGVEYQLQNWMHTGDGGWAKRYSRL